MPAEVFDKEQFIEISGRASECRVVRSKEGVIKLKLRTKTRLYTLKVYSEDEAREILSRVKCPVVEVGRRR